ncbi:helix-turn-helix transcriptional regulator [Halolamina sp. CBA1230]|uniref:helix-turn-helix transcriptional regulator n=1 Tax=Halolamina sp. CBA1230 TaxID=1853690 RepID=UPI0009A1FA58|nr:helix-turn-helix transcriptional regulator [Halolamina sp. CBA1230]QKY18893.1 helix-turn-helix transcriptional regulator [Halolamina sp. CBA1230]
MSHEIVTTSVGDGDAADAAGHDVDGSLIDDLRAILGETKIRLLQQILASPTGALSAVELAARNSITESTIRDHLRELAEREEPIVTTLDAETDEPVPNGVPRKYYAVTEHGIDLLKRVGLYEQIGILYDMYEAADLRLPDAEDRPVSIERIEAYEHRPSPDWL